jgi:hypothetical protein
MTLQTDFDERYFIAEDGHLKTPLKLSGKTSSYKKPPAVPPKKIMESGTLKRLKGDDSVTFAFARKLDFNQSLKSTLQPSIPL